MFLDSEAHFRGLESMWQLDAPVAEPVLDVQPRSDCQTLSPSVRGKDYTGSVDVSRSGKACLPWAGVDAMPGSSFAEVQQLPGSACRCAPLDRALACSIAAMMTID